MFATEQQKV